MCVGFSQILVKTCRCGSLTDQYNRLNGFTTAVLQQSFVVPNDSHWDKPVFVEGTGLSSRLDRPTLELQLQRLTEHNGFWCACSCPLCELTHTLVGSTCMLQWQKMAASSNFKKQILDEIRLLGSFLTIHTDGRTPQLTFHQISIIKTQYFPDKTE